MLIIFLGGLIVTWTMFSARLATAEQEIDQLSKVVTEINEIKLDIARIQKDIEFIRDNLKTKGNSK